jgi:hypothetical protein
LSVVGQFYKSGHEGGEEEDRTADESACYVYEARLRGLYWGVIGLWVSLVREKKMPSSAFDAFVESYFGDIDAVWLYGLDRTVLDKLEGTERDAAERMLLESLGGGDYRVAAGLGILRTQKALEGLK